MAGIFVFAGTLGAPPEAQAQSAPGFSGTEFRITSDPYSQVDPAIAGDLIVWTDDRRSQGDFLDHDVWFYDLATGVEQAVTDEDGDQELADVSDGIIVFNNGGSDLHIWAYWTDSGARQDLMDGVTTGVGTRAAIGQGLVAWVDTRDDVEGDEFYNWEIYGRDLATGEVRRVSESPLLDSYPAVNGRRIVWVRRAAFEPADLWAYDWTSGATRALTSTALADERLPDLSGDRLVFQRLDYGSPLTDWGPGDDWDIVHLDLSTGVETRLSLAGAQGNPHISGEVVAFEDYATGVSHIRLWHLPSGQVFDVPAGPSWQFLNDIDGNRVVYTDDRNGNYDIYLFAFSIVTAPPPPPQEPDCASLEEVAPLAELVVTRDNGRPVTEAMEFAAAAGAGLLCLDNAYAGTTPTSGTKTWLNGATVVTGDDWSVVDDLGDFVPVAVVEKRVDLREANKLEVRMVGKPGSSIRARVYALENGQGVARSPKVHRGLSVDVPTLAEARVPGSAMAPAQVADEPELASQRSPLSYTQPGYGCSQGSGALWFPVLLAVFAWVLLPRRAEVRAGSRRRR